MQTSNTDPLEAFAANVKRLREQKGMTQEMLAELSGVSLTDITRLEALQYEPGVEVAASLAYGLGVATGDLLVGVEYRSSADGARPSG